VHAGILWGNLRERDYMEDVIIDGRILLKWILRHLVGRARTGWICLRAGKIIGSCEWLMIFGKEYRS
jgi:hypothetical protein